MSNQHAGCVASAYYILCHSPDQLGPCGWSDAEHNGPQFAAGFPLVHPVVHDVTAITDPAGSLGLERDVAWCLTT